MKKELIKPVSEMTPVERKLFCNELRKNFLESFVKNSPSISVACASAENLGIASSNEIKDVIKGMVTEVRKN